MDIVHPAIERYLSNLATGDDEPVLLEMEALAKEKGFPIIGRLCGRSLEVMARAVNAKRIFELGSGYGYSAYWFVKAAGLDAEIHLTDGDPENERLAKDFLTRAGLIDPIRYHVGDALESFDSVEGEFDVVYCDIDKPGYPDAWRKSRDRVRVSGLFMCDNMLWDGRVTGEVENDNTRRDDWTNPIVETNRMIVDDPDYRSFINPTRDGVVVAIRTR
ncbi:MAG: O-methyltransferase [Actinomycetota bacterium]|nr:O-methyltransferase [Actinomycetota bacterium]